MKSAFCFPRIVFVVVTGMLLMGCLFKPATVSNRHFILSPISTNEPAPIATNHLSVGIGFIKIPSYLLRNSIAIRNGANEIEYLDNAQWAERLDLCFERTLAANLAQLLHSDSIYLTEWRRDQVMVKMSITVHQFDVDSRGRGTLIAQWRIAAPDSDTTLKSGGAHLDRSGTPPRGNPEVVAATLSDLAAEFSRELAQSIRKSVTPGP